MKSLGSIIDLFRKGMRLTNPEGLKEATYWNGFLLALHGFLYTRGIDLPWMTQDLMAEWGSAIAITLGTFLGGSTVVTSRKVGLPFLGAKRMAAPAGTDSAAWKTLDPVARTDDAAWMENGRTVQAEIDSRAVDALPPIEAGRFDASRIQVSQRLNQKRITVPAALAGLTYVQALRHLRNPRTYIARANMIEHRGYILQRDDDASRDAGQLVKNHLNKFMPAMTVPWHPSAADLAANDWFVIDGFDPATDEYLNPAQPDMGCAVKVANHNGQSVLEKDHCVNERGLIVPVTRGKPEPVGVEAVPVIKSVNKYGKHARKLANLLESDNIKAFLSTIRYAEGTAKPEHYFVQFGYTEFKDISDKPRKVISKGKYRSSAAGAYQIINNTWDHIQRNLNLPDFSPLSQDIAALFLIEEENQIENILTGNIDAALHGVGNVWASFPNNNYGQPQRTAQKLLAKYEQNRGVA